MTSGPTSEAYLVDHLHNHPDAYCCADCHRFTLDRDHLVDPLLTKHVMLDNWLLTYAAYNRQMRILEICFNHGTRHQYRNVPLATAVALVRASGPAKYWKENIGRDYRSLRSPQVPHGTGDSDGDGESSHRTYQFERVIVQQDSESGVCSRKVYSVNLYGS